MSPNISFENGSNQKQHQNTNDISCDIQGKRQTFRNLCVSKGVEEQHHTKYVTNDGKSSTCSERAKENRGKNCKQNNGSSQPSSAPCCYEDVSRIDENDPHAPLLYYASEADHPLPAPHCYDVPRTRNVPPCSKQTRWQTGKYCRDECGSGIVPLRFDFRLSRRIWCRTPLTTYQATHGELGKQILCREKIIKRNINPGPPCNVCEYVLPLCRGYYRKYDCIKPCDDEADNIVYKDGRNRPRDKVERYWEACTGIQEKTDINTFAPQNMALSKKLRKRFDGVPCW